MTAATAEKATETTSQVEVRLAKAAADLAAAVRAARPTCDSRWLQIGGCWNELRGPDGKYGYTLKDEEGELHRVQISLHDRRKAFIQLIQAEPDLKQAMADSGPPYTEVVEARVRGALTPILDQVFLQMMTGREEMGKLLRLAIAGREWLLSGEGSPHGLAGRLADLRMAAAWCRQHPEALPGRHRPVIEKLAALLEQEGNELHDALLSMTWPELEALAAKLK